MDVTLNSVPSVQIDDGRFKYVLIKVYEPENESNFKYIVRGFISAAYHADIYDDVAPKIEELGLECECVGGGRIKHNPEEKSIHVFGYSQHRERGRTSWWYSWWCISMINHASGVKENGQHDLRLLCGPALFLPKEMMVASIVMHITWFLGQLHVPKTHHCC